VRAARANLEGARAALAKAESSVSARPPAAGATTDGADGRLVQARALFERSYRRYQSLLAAFLETALTERPEAASTREALSLYTHEAVANARETLLRGGDKGRVRDVLVAVRRYQDLAGVPSPVELTEALAAAAVDARTGAPRTAPRPTP